MPTTSAAPSKIKALEGWREDTERHWHSDSGTFFFDLVPVSFKTLDLDPITWLGHSPATWQVAVSPILRFSSASARRDGKAEG